MCVCDYLKFVSTDETVGYYSYHVYQESCWNYNCRVEPVLLYIPKIYYKVTIFNIYLNYINASASLQLTVDSSDWIGIPGKKTYLPIELSPPHGIPLSDPTVYIMLEVDVRSFPCSSTTHSCHVSINIILFLIQYVSVLLLYTNL